MASAGRILIMPKGEWNAETEYEMLDLVFHDGASWIAKKVSTGIEPIADNSEYWQMLIDVNTIFNSYLLKKTISIGSEESPLVIPAGESIGGDVDIALDGYIPIAISGYKLNSVVSSLTNIYISGSGLYYRARNDSDNEVTLKSADVYILYRRIF